MGSRALLLKETDHLMTIEKYLKIRKRNFVFIFNIYFIYKDWNLSWIIYRIKSIYRSALVLERSCVKWKDLNTSVRRPDNLRKIKMKINSGFWFRKNRHFLKNGKPYLSIGSKLVLIGHLYFSIDKICT